MKSISTGLKVYQYNIGNGFMGGSIPPTEQNMFNNLKNYNYEVFKRT